MIVASVLSVLVVWSYIQGSSRGVVVVPARMGAHVVGVLFMNLSCVVHVFVCCSYVVLSLCIPFV